MTKDKLNTMTTEQLEKWYADLTYYEEPPNGLHYDTNCRQQPEIDINLAEEILAEIFVRNGWSF